MTVKELIAMLSTCHGDDLVILAKDSEGNDFSPLDEGVSENMYAARSEWSGEIHLRKLTREDEEQGYTEEDVWTTQDGAVPCVVLWPRN